MELRSAHCVSNLNQSAPFKVGDFVLLHEDKQPKHMWKMGRIEETFMGRDGKIRSCAVRLPSRLILRRPVQLLYVESIGILTRESPSPGCVTSLPEWGVSPSN